MHTIFEEVLDQRFNYCVTTMSFQFWDAVCWLREEIAEEGY